MDLRVTPVVRDLDDMKPPDTLISWTINGPELLLSPHLKCFRGSLTEKYIPLTRRQEAALNSPGAGDESECNWYERRIHDKFLFPAATLLPKSANNTQAWQDFRMSNE